MSVPSPTYSSVMFTLTGCGSTPYVSRLLAFFRKFVSASAGTSPLKQQPMPSQPQWHVWHFFSDFFQSTIQQPSQLPKAWPMTEKANLLELIWLDIEWYCFRLVLHRMLSDVIRCYRMSSDVIVCHRMLSDVIGCYQMLSDVIGCHHMSSDVIGCYRMSSDVIVCHRMLSDVIGCYQMVSDGIGWY